jgi:predicted anti-sigma-YlaC factor YlaD
MRRQSIVFLAVTSLLATAGPGCSVKRIAVNKLANALASSGTTFESDDDPDLIGQALPFALKMMESLLAESPRHSGLLLATASGFTEYSYAFVGQRAEQVFTESVDESNALRGRARRLYVRAHAYGMRALEVRYPGFGAVFPDRPQTALARVAKRDVPLLYWTAAAQGLAIAASKDNPEMIAQMSEVEAFIRRAVELDPGWNQGALPEFLINIEAARQDVSAEERRKRIDAEFAEALRLSTGKRASLFVSYAENSAIPAQNRVQFRELLGRALAVDPDRQAETRLATLLAQRRARWLLGRVDDLFADAEVH